MKTLRLNILLCTLAGLLCISCQPKDPVKIIFKMSPDNTGTLSELIAKFNEAHTDDIIVEYQEAAWSSNEFYDQLAVDFTIENYELDVWGADVVWTPIFATEGWAEDLSERFYDVYSAEQFIPAAFNSVIYQNKVWGIPWYIDAGLMYYRKDLLDKHGFDSPPVTWDELKTMCDKILPAEEGVEYGIVFQADAYEGGVVNACEFIWNSGGEVMVGDLSISGTFDEVELDPNIVTINSSHSISGLSQAQELLAAGYTAPDIMNYREYESSQAFAEGKALFMRGWPSASGLFSKPDAKVTQNMVGIGLLPVQNAGMTSYSCLGGWNLMINAHSTQAEKDAAWKFVLYLTDAASQKYTAKMDVNFPTLKVIYEDKELLKQVPVMANANEAILRTRNRPVSPYYMEMSPFIGTIFHKIVKGDITPTQGVEDLETQLLKIIEHHRPVSGQ